MTTDAILALIDALLSKAPHSDGCEQARLLLNELRERIIADNEDGNDANIYRRIRGIIRSDDFERARQMEGRLAQFNQRIQEQAAQLCAVRNAAGMQTGTIEELCQRITGMRQDSDAWETMLRIVRANGFESVGQVLARVDHFRAALLRIHVCGDSTEHRIAREALGV